MEVKELEQERDRVAASLGPAESSMLRAECSRSKAAPAHSRSLSHRQYIIDIHLYRQDTLEDEFVLAHVLGW